MDTNPIDPGLGSIFGGLAIVLGLALVVLLLGVWIAAQFRRGRVNEETDISYPSVPQSADDRRAVAEVREREHEMGDHTVEAVPAGSGMREAPQVPTRVGPQDESQPLRPVDAADQRDEPVVDGGQGPRSPL